MHGRMHTRAAWAALLPVGVGLTTALSGTASAGAARLSLAQTAHHAATKLPKRTNSAGNPIFGFPESWSLTHHDVLDIVGGLLIALLLFVVLALRVRRRHRNEYVRVGDMAPRVFPVSAESWRGTGMAEESSAPLPRFQPSTVVLPGPERGWHPVEGDRARIAYWDGSRWAAFRQWDGQEWVEPTAATT
jgi:hypothetical protein